MQHWITAQFLDVAQKHLTEQNDNYGNVLYRKKLKSNASSQWDSSKKLV